MLSDYNFYKIVNATEFLALGLPSQEIEAVIENVGLRDILVTIGFNLGILYDGVFLTINLNDKNPFEFDGHSIYIDDNEDVWLGIEKEDE